VEHAIIRVTCGSHWITLDADATHGPVRATIEGTAAVDAIT